MTSELRRRCLLIMPLTFYTLHDQFRSTLKRFGYSVDLLNEEYPANTAGKVLAKLALPIARWTTLLKLREHLRTHDRYDLVLIVKGRGLGREAIRLLKQNADRVIGYNFDSFRFNPSPLDWHSLADRYATFDIVDADTHRLPLVHLFSAAQAHDVPAKSQYLISIVMRLHSDRLAYVDQVVHALKNRQFFAYLYASSWLTFLPLALRSPGAVFRLRRYIHFVPLSYDKAMHAIADSAATLDYAHPLQSGITVRCFEAQSMGVPVITNNAHVAESGVFAEGSVASFPLGGDSEQLLRTLNAFTECRFEPTLRTIDEFMADLLDENPNT